jgi:stage II sporulation protein D
MPWLPRVMRRLVAAAAIVLVACSATSVGGGTRGATSARQGRIVRIALGPAAKTVRLTATGGWRLYERGGASVLVRGNESDVWTVEREGTRLRAVRTGGARTPLGAGPFVARPEDDRSFIRVGAAGKRYRGDIFVSATDSGLIVVNHLPVESYLRGVVPLEIGDRVTGEESAVAAQAVAARSFTYSRLADLGPSPARAWDLVASVSDQVYGGVDAEKPIADAAVTMTGNLVLKYAGRIVNAVYSSTCGGTTAEAPELWQTRGEPYLQRVSDRIPGTDRFYCDLSPRFAWTRALDARTLASGLEAYLRTYTTVTGAIGTVRTIEVASRTASGRAATLAITTDRGRHVLRGNNIRYVLRQPGGEILNSTYFTVEPTVANGRLTHLAIAGNGYGHGVGMCQWGAIGRSRAGQDFRTILTTYYPGTSVEPIS